MLQADRPLLVVGFRRAFDYYQRHEYRGDRKLEFCPTIHHFRGRRFIMADIVWLHGATDIRDFDEIYRYARYVDSVYDSRDSDESRTVRGGGQEAPPTD